MLAVLAAAVLFSLADPQGDARGDGSYRLPAGIEEGAVDLRTFTAADEGGHLQFRMALARLANGGQSPNGFSDAQVDVFLQDGGQRKSQLGATGFSAPPGTGWRYHVSANGWSAHLEAAGEDAPVGKVTARAEGTDVVVDTPLPAGEYRYWVTVSLFDPLTADGLRRPVNDAAPFNLYASRAGTPLPLDVLAEGSQVSYYASGVLPSVGPDLDRSRWLLLAGLIGALLALGATIWGLFRR